MLSRFKKKKKQKKTAEKNNYRYRQAEEAVLLRCVAWRYFTLRFEKYNRVNTLYIITRSEHARLGVNEHFGIVKALLIDSLTENRSIQLEMRKIPKKLTHSEARRATPRR